MLVLAKSPAFYRNRITNSIALLCLGIGMGLIYHYAGLQAIAQVIPMLTFILLLSCMFLGVHLTADGLAKEKREGTIGLLFLTNLTPFQILLGKLIAHGLMGFYAILIVVPLLSLVMILGGLRLGELASITVNALNVLFFSAAVGLWASSRHTDRKKAGAAGTWTVVFFWWGISIILQALHHFKAPLWLLHVVGAFSVNGMFNSTFAGPRVRLIASPWINFAVTHLMAWGFLGLAVYFLRHRWQDAPPRERFNLREWWKKKSLGNAVVRRRLKDRLLDRNPFLWLASRERLRSLGLWIVTVGFLGVMAWQLRYGWPAASVLCSMLVTLCMIHKLSMGATSAHQLSTEQEQGTLEMLLSTPLSAREVLQGQVMASIRHFRGPVVLSMVVALGIFLLLWNWQVFGAGTALGIAALVIYSFIHLLELYAMIWAGMWAAATVKEAKNAAGAAMARIIGLPLLVFGMTLSSWGAASYYWRWGMEFNPILVIGYYLFLCIANSVGWLIYFRTTLPNRLREFALRRYTPEDKKTFWGTLGGWFGKTWRNQPPRLQSSIPGLPGNVRS